jgi:Ca2+:H+ antiporter
VVLLHLLLVPGAAFLTGGADIWEQDLHPVHTQLNHTLLTVGYVFSYPLELRVTAPFTHRVLALLLPASFYAAISGSTSNAISANGELPNLGSSTQTDFLRMSRGLAILLLLM